THRVAAASPLAALGQLLEVALAAAPQQPPPFVYLVQELHPARSLRQNPLFQVMLTLEPPPPPLPAGWAVSQMEVETGTSKFDLTLKLEDRPDGLLARFQYSSDLFDEATIARLTGHWQRPLEGIVADPAQPIAAYPVLTDRA